MTIIVKFSCGVAGSGDKSNQELGNWAGFDPAKVPGNAHRAVVSWYGGTANLNESQIPD
ncbi:MAG: hypothetical protein F6K17_22415 [Okeania sp. SIO3C4]|nr:hypothetical protein [Okeania sp. SIO3B3]NER05150.1 hypothetical protein [Okeania sp. SIO3C4]